MCETINDTGGAARRSVMAQYEFQVIMLSDVQFEMSVCLFMLSRLNHLNVCIKNIYCLFLTVSVQWGLWFLSYSSVKCVEKKPPLNNTIIHCYAKIRNKWVYLRWPENLSWHDFQKNIYFMLWVNDNYQSTYWFDYNTS